MEQMDFVFQKINKKLFTSMIIICENNLKTPDHLSLLNCIEVWSAFHQQNNAFYTSVPYKVENTIALIRSLNLNERTHESSGIIQKYIKRFNKNAKPNIVLALERCNWFGSTPEVLYHVNIGEKYILLLSNDLNIFFLCVGKKYLM